MTCEIDDGTRLDEVRRIGGMSCDDGTGLKEDLVRSIGVDEREVVVLAWVCNVIWVERGFCRLCGETLLSTGCSGTTGGKVGGRAVRIAAEFCENCLNGAAHDTFSELADRGGCREGNEVRLGGSILCYIGRVPFRPPLKMWVAA